MSAIVKGARCYLHTARHLGWLPPRLRAAHQALWLGLLETEALNEVTRSLYSSSSGFDSEEHNFGGLSPWEREVVRKHFTGCQRILVAGAGGGREALALATLGFTVTAFDFCDTLTAACRKHVHKAGFSVEVLDAAPDALPEGLDLYDGIFAGRGFYHHIPNRRRRMEFLKCCRAHVAPEGPLFLSDFFSRPSVSMGHRKIQFIANTIRWLRRSHEAVELGDWLSDCMQHAFLQSEIESELRQGGFRPELYAISPVGQESSLAHAVGIATPGTDES